MDRYDSTPQWFAPGLRFKCTGCGQCCTGAAGSVYLSQTDVERLAMQLGLTAGAVVRKFSKKTRGRRYLIDQPNHDCVFLRDKKCTVYDARPTQCRTYPWWLSNIRDAESWAEAARFCEGIDHPAASLVPFDEIIEQCRLDEENEARA